MFISELRPSLNTKPDQEPWLLLTHTYMLILLTFYLLENFMIYLASPARIQSLYMNT